MKPENEILKQKVHDHRNELKRCPFCNSGIEDRKITLYKGFIDALYKVYIYCGQHRTYRFEMKEIKHLLGKNEYARFGDIVRFGGIVYKPKEEDGHTRKAVYGMNMDRAKQFFEGTYQIPVQITIDQITGEKIDETLCSVDDFPSLVSLLREDGLYDYKKDVQMSMF